MSIEPALTTFLVFTLLILILTWMSRRIGLLIQENVFRLTGSADLAMVILFLVYLPGILVHEGAHWITAKLLGLRTGKFRVWPQKQGRQIGMGSVSVARGGAVADSAVGLAPLVFGSLIVSWIGTQVFQTPQISVIWQTGEWWAGFQATRTALLANEDGLLWSYLLFATANAMIPSSSDREPLKSLLLYVLIFGILYFWVDQSGQILSQVAGWLLHPLQLLVSSLFFIVVLNALILILLQIVQILLATLRPSLL